jgi:hypothetical protein
MLTNRVNIKIKYEDTMDKRHQFRFTIVLGIVVMIVSFAIVPESYPWYYEFLLFNVGLWPWLFAKNELNKMKLQLNSN